MNVVDILSILMIIGGIAAFVIPLRQSGGPLAWVLSISFFVAAIIIFFAVVFKRKQFKKVFTHKFALTIAVTLAFILIFFGLLANPLLVYKK